MWFMAKIRKKTKLKSEVLRKHCVELAKKIAKLLVGEVCEHCGRRKKDGWQIQGSHIYPEGIYRAMSTDTDNILSLCSVCHIGGLGMLRNVKSPSWHNDPAYFVDWANKKYPKRMKELKLRARQNQQADEQFWEIKLKQLSKQYQKLCQIQQKQKPI